MSYQVIARKWRPQDFHQLVGQGHISQTLLNALSSGRLAHALLFTGPRGTGKTSTARILAKALRCENPKDFSPCNTCNSCVEIAQGRSVDVIEIDGASNNGVDAVRELRETVGYMPASGKHKIYIIDEVHMLSISAFNALLKTLEEPPAHVLFTLATTEVHKIPQTILSRCQRFDFRRISTKLITDHLKAICEKENIKAEAEALWMIARQGDGSMRDSQSLLDQVITFAAGDLSYAKVVEILGLTDRSLVLETLQDLLARDTLAILKTLEKLLQSGVEPSLFSQELLEAIRNLMIAKISGEASQLILDVPDSEAKTLANLGANFSESDIHMLFDMALKGASDITKASDSRIVLEMVLLRMAQAPNLVDIAQLVERAAAAPLPGSPHSSAKSSAPKSLATPASSATASKAPGHNMQAPPSASAKPEERWLHLVGQIKEKDAIFGAKIDSILFLGLNNKAIQLGIPDKMQFLKQHMEDKNFVAKLKSYIDQFWGQGYAIESQVTKDVSVGLSAGALAEKKEMDSQELLKKEISQHPLVKTAQTVFRGQIKDIKENR